MMRPLKKGMPGAWPALALVFGMAAIVAAIGPAESAEVRITPRLEVRETYTDNVNLTPTDSLVPGDIRQDDFVTTVSPGLSAQITGTRVQLRANYTANYLIFANLGMDDLRHSLQSSATIEPIENYLSIDTQASIAQQFLDREGGFSGSEANLTGNRGTIRSFSSSPRFAARFGQIAETTVRYTFSYITTNDERMLEGLADTLTDAVRHSASINITSGPAFGRLRWSLNGDIDRENREDSTGTDVPNFGGETVSLGLQYALDRTFSLRGSVSYRDTDNVSLTDPGNNLAWDAGLNVNPNRRLSMNFTVGKNQGNTTFGGSLDYQWTNKTRVSINYTDRIQTSQVALASNLPQIGPGDDGGLVDEDGFPFDPTRPNLGFDSRISRDKDLRAGASYTSGRMSFNAGAFVLRREFDRAGGESLRYGGNVGITRTFSRNTTGSASFSIDNDQFEGSARGDITTVTQASINRTIGELLAGRLTFIRSDRNSNEVGADIKEIAVTVALEARF